MIRKKFRRLSLFLAILMFLASLCGCSSDDNIKIQTSYETTWTDTIIYGSHLWAVFPLDEAISLADNIVYGTISEKGKTNILSETDPEHGWVTTNYFRDTTIDVTECLKGEHRRAYTYQERGGISGGFRYVYDGYKPSEVGQTMLLFTYYTDYCVSPEARLIANENNRFAVYKSMLPEGYEAEFNNAGYTWIDADEYVAIVREAIAAQEHPPLQTAP